MRIEGSINGQINQSGTADILSRLNIGDIVRAKVMDITANELMLKLFDGTIINAGTMSPIDVKKGELVDFIVKNNVNNQLFMETLKVDVKNSAASLDEIKKELLELGIKPDKRSMEAAREIKSNEIPLNKETINKVIDAVAKFKHLTVDKAAYLVSKNIIPEEKSISSLNQLVDGKIKVGMQLKDLLGSLIELTDKDISSIIGKKLEDIDSIYLKQGEGARSEKGVMQSDIITKENIPGDKKNLQAESLKKDMSFLLETIEKEMEGLDIGKKDTSLLKEKIIDFINFNKGNVKDPKDLIEYLKSGIKDFDLAFKGREKLTEDIFNSILNKLKTSESTMNKDIFTGNSDDRDAPEVIRKSFEKMFVRINEDTNKEDINVKEMYKSIYEKLEAVKNTLEHSNVFNKEEILSKVDNLQNNLRFINDINSHSAYIQIPLKMWDKSTTGELYILKRNSSKKRIDPNNATVFLSLHTQNLGQVDSLISVDRKNISLNLRLEKSEIIDFIKGNYKELYNSLLDKGYKLVDVKYRLIDEKVNILNVSEVLGKDIKTGRQAFDCKI